MWFKGRLIGGCGRWGRDRGATRLTAMGGAAVGQRPSGCLQKRIVARYSNGQQVLRRMSETFYVSCKYVVVFSVVSGKGHSFLRLDSNPRTAGTTCWGGFDFGCVPWSPNPRVGTQAADSSGTVTGNSPCGSDHAAAGEARGRRRQCHRAAGPLGNRRQTDALLCSARPAWLQAADRRDAGARVRAPAVVVEGASPRAWRRPLAVATTPHRAAGCIWRRSR